MYAIKLLQVNGYPIMVLLCGHGMGGLFLGLSENLKLIVNIVTTANIIFMIHFKLTIYLPTK